MNNLSYGDLTSSVLLTRQAGLQKQQITILGQESTTGVASDIGAKVQGALGPLLGLEKSLTKIEGFMTVTADVKQHLAAVQVAVESLSKTALDLSSTILSVLGSQSPVRLENAARSGEESFQSAVAILNTRSGDRSLFSGQSLDLAPVSSADDILNELVTLTSGMTTAQDVQTAVDGWFMGAAGFEVSAYHGGPALGPVEVSAGEMLIFGVTATDPALRETLRGLALTALLNRGVLAGQPDQKMALARSSALDLQQSELSRAMFASDVGVHEKSVDTAQSRNQAERTALTLARSEIVGVDEYETATRLREAEARLEKIFAITARLMRLSLLDFMR